MDSGREKGGKEMIRESCDDEWDVETTDAGGIKVPSGKRNHAMLCVMDTRDSEPELGTTADGNPIRVSLYAVLIIVGKGRRDSLFGNTGCSRLRRGVCSAKMALQ